MPLYYNSHQKKMLLAMSIAGAMLLGVKQNIWDFPKYVQTALKRVDDIHYQLLIRLDEKTKRQLRRMVKNDIITDDTDDLCMNMLCCLYYLTDVAEAFKQYTEIYLPIRYARGQIKRFLKTKYNRDELADKLVELYFSLKEA